MEGSAAPNGGSYPAITEQEGRVPLLQHRDGGEKKRMDLLPFLHISVFGILVTLGIGSVVVGILAEYYNYVEKSRKVPRYSWCASYPSERIILLGSLGTWFVLTAEIFATVAGYCVLCANGQTTNPHERRARNILGASWVCCLFAIYKFQAGSLAKDMNESGSSLGSCEIVQAAAFVGASLSALVALSLAMGFYVQKCSVKDAENGAIPDADQV